MQKRRQIKSSSTNPFTTYKKAVAKRKRRERYGRLTKNILVALATGTALFFVLGSPSGTRKFYKGLKEEWHPKRARLSLERLHAKKLIAFSERADGSFHVLLTEEGEQKTKVWQLETLRIEPPKRWDYKWRVVAFDIAEKRKMAREALRDLLKQLGFYQLQKSIFIYPYPCEAEIELIKMVFDIPQHELICFIADAMPHHNFLKKQFNL